MHAQLLNGGIVHTALATIFERGLTDEAAASVIDALRTRSARAVLLDLEHVEHLTADQINWLVNLVTTVRLLGFKPRLVGVCRTVVGELEASCFHVESLSIDQSANR